MRDWTAEELDTIGAADELEIAALRPDGTLRPATTIWVVRVGDDLYVRSYRGRGGGWFGSVLRHPEGRIRAGGVTREVAFQEPGDVRVEERDDPTIIEPTDAILRLSATCVCGSDLWPYRGLDAVQGPSPMGHEYVGVVQEVGSQVRDIRPGQFVVGSFFASDNTCELCQAGYQSSCIHREPVGAEGAQAEFLRVPLADGTLVATPELPSDDLVPSLLAASGVLGTGWFGAVAAEAGPGKTVAVVGDGGEDGVARIKELTNGLGAHSVVEAVGTQESILQAIGSTRPGGHVGYVGVAHDVELPGTKLFFSHVHLHGGPAPVRRFLPELIDLIWNRRIDPGKVFDLTLPLEQAAEGYRAMDERRAIKTLLRP